MREHSANLVPGKGSPPVSLLRAALRHREPVGVGVVRDAELALLSVARGERERPRSSPLLRVWESHRRKVGVGADLLSHRHGLEEPKLRARSRHERCADAVQRCVARARRVLHIRPAAEAQRLTHARKVRLCHLLCRIRETVRGSEFGLGRARPRLEVFFDRGRHRLVHWGDDLAPRPPVEHLEPVVLRRIVARRDHHPRGAPTVSHRKGKKRRGGEPGLEQGDSEAAGEQRLRRDPGKPARAVPTVEPNRDALL
mmetsp:Transcript_21157/g.68464  ORF Transcript_21157/g.68464 Transcript_21157/m.68464 type:complete len:255 (-) Transcript_21157:335-1099(-)